MTTDVTTVEGCFVTLKQLVDMINEERLEVGKSRIRHDRSMGKVEELATHRDFGQVSKKDIWSDIGSGAKRAITTYCLTEEQAMIVASKLDNKRLIYVVKKLRELSQPTKLTRKELLLQGLAQEEEIERLGQEWQIVNKKLEETQKEKTKLVDYVRKEHAPGLVTITVTQLSADWVKQVRLSAQKITACFYGLGVYDGRFLEKAMLRVNSHIPSTEYRNWFKSDIEKTRGGATWYEIEIYQEYADKLALMLTALTDAEIDNMWEEYKERKTMGY